MKMTIHEKKALFAFGCPSREATVQRLRLVADLSPELTVKKALIALADKLNGKGVDEWYRCFFYNMRLGNGSLLLPQGGSGAHPQQQYGGAGR
jgi:hypothetical protein